MESPSQHPTLPLYEDFVKDAHVAAGVKEINRFAYTVQYAPNGVLTHPQFTDDVIAACLETLAAVLPDTGIHSLHAIKVMPQRSSEPTVRLDPEKSIVSVALQDSRDQFKISVYDDRIAISRDASSFRDFYEWYYKFMPAAQTVETTIRRAIGRSSLKILTPVQTSYEFKINFSDFINTGTRVPAHEPRNVDVLQSLIQAFPDSRGLVELANQDFYRIDLTFSRLEDFHGPLATKRRTCWYFLEAPFNENGRFLVLTAQLRNASYDLLSEPNRGVRQTVAPFDDNFADDYYIALVEFLRDRALGSFMAKLLENWKFSTQRQS